MARCTGISMEASIIYSLSSWLSTPVIFGLWVKRPIEAATKTILFCYSIAISIFCFSDAHHIKSAIHSISQLKLSQHTFIILIPVAFGILLYLSVLLSFKHKKNRNIHTVSLSAVCFVVVFTTYTPALLFFSFLLSMV